MESLNQPKQKGSPPDVSYTTFGHNSVLSQNNYGSLREDVQLSRRFKDE